MISNKTKTIGAKKHLKTLRFKYRVRYLDIV